MDDGVNKEDNKGQNMGASSNLNSAKIATLQERKKVIEETLAKHNQELRQLCIQEGELTGVMPVEYPLDPGETPPSFRRRIGTAYQLPQSLLNNVNAEEEIAALELELWNCSKMAEAALGLANENNQNKTVKRTHMADYQKYKQRYNAIEEKLQFLKSRSTITVQQPKQPSPLINQQPKQRKKPRPVEQDDAISMNANQVGSFGKNTFRHSSRSLQHTSTLDNAGYKYTNQSHPRLAHRGSDSTSLNENMNHYQGPEDVIPSFYSLSLNGYQEYAERHETDNSPGLSHYSQSSTNLYKPSPPQYNNPTHTLPYIRRSPQSIIAYSNHYQDYHKLNNNLHANRQMSPGTSSGSSTKYYTVQGPVYNPHPSDSVIRNLNPHQIQPHQQYEHDVMNSGLGGYWKRSENGEMFWCNSSNDIISSQKDKRFGSLDRRKNKRLQKQLAQNVDPKSATLGSVPIYHESSRVVHSKVAHKHRQDNRQLVRTQSLGSVGGQTVDSVCQSDDSSAGSETLSYNEHSNNIRKQKQKEWYETALDGPTNSIPSASRSHSTVPSISPDDKYVDYTPPISTHAPLQMSYSVPIAQPQSPQTPKPPLEIPAESNPSPRIQEINLEIFNNNLPKHATVIQHAQWKPYREETKSFEMSDFFKYSTKYNKRSPQKSAPEEITRPQSGFQKLPSPQATTSNENFEDDTSTSVIQKGVYQPLQPMECQPYSPVSNNMTMHSIGSPLSLNASLDLSQLAPNVAEKFTDEMNAWFQNHEHQNDNNNATLV